MNNDIFSRKSLILTRVDFDKSKRPRLKFADQITGEIKDTYSIVTTQANQLMAEIHNTKKRMPIILKPEDESKWLQHEPINKFAYPYEVYLIATKLDNTPQGLLF